MFQAINDAIVNAMDYLLGWITFLPRDAQLFVVAIMTSAILAGVRLWTTDQNWLGRADADKKRLGELVKLAKAARDKDAKARYKQTATLIKVKSLRFEGKPLLWAIVPIALLATWCFGRLGYEPVRPGQSVEVRMFVPAAAIGSHPHMLPVEGLAAESGWVGQVVKDSPPQINGRWDAVNAKIASKLGMTPPLEGVAKWRIKTPDHAGSYLLKIRYGGKTYEKHLRVHPRYQGPAVDVYDEKVQAIETVMKPLKLFGAVGGLDFLFLPPWLVAYLLIAIPFVTVIKWVFRIY